MRIISMVCGLSFLASAGLVHAQAAPTTPTVAATGRYSTATTPLSVLFSDPAAKAVVAKSVPNLVSNPDVAERASGMTLKEIQEATKAYAPEMLTDAVLAQIDQDLAKLPAKN